MTKNNFLNQLRNQLSAVSKEEQDRVIEYYSEIINDKIDDGKSEEQAISELNSPQKIAQKIIEDYENTKTEAYASVYKHSKAVIPKKRSVGAMVGFDVKALDLCGEPRQVVKEYSTDELKSISVDFMSNYIIIKKSATDKIKFTYYTTDCCPASIKYENGEIYLGNDFNAFEYNLKQFTKGFFHGIRKFGLDTVIEIPNGCTDININIDISNGEIEAEDIIANDIYLQTSNGNITAKNINANTLKADTSNGKVTLSGVTVKNLINTTTSNGKIILSDITAKKLINTETSNGAIEIEDIASDNIILQTSNSAIQGNIIGNADDYNVSSSTSNGNDSLAVYNGKNTASDKKLEVETSNGSISVEFTK